MICSDEIQCLYGLDIVCDYNNMLSRSNTVALDWTEPLGLFCEIHHGLHTRFSRSYTCISWFYHRCQKNRRLLHIEISRGQYWVLHAVIIYSQSKPMRPHKHHTLKDFHTVLGPKSESRQWAEAVKHQNASWLNES